MSNTRKATKRPRISVVKPKQGWGLYMWRLPNGKLFKDDDGNYLNIPSLKGDIEKMSQLKQAAAYYGQPEGTLHFEPGVERLTDEQFSSDQDRIKAGLIPEYNLASIVDAKNARAVHGDAE